MFKYLSIKSTTHFYNYQVQKAALADFRWRRSAAKKMRNEGLVDQNTKMKEGVEEIMDNKYDPAANTKPYILGSFGSAWVCMRVRMIFLLTLFQGKKKSKL